MSNSIQLGDSAPWFDAKTIASASVSLSVVGGRWIVLCFLGSLNDAETIRALAEILGEAAALFRDDHMVFYGVLIAIPEQAQELASVSHKALGFIADLNGTITRDYDAATPRIIVLDPLLRVANIFPLGKDGAPTENIRKYLRELSAVDDYAGVPLMAPALIVPNIFEPSFCDFLIDMYEKGDNVESGFMLDKGGKTETVVNHNLKSRRDLVIDDPKVREMMRERIVRRLIPAIERFFQYRPTRMDRYLVSCYDVNSGGHFSRHRDNINAGARHRRFAVSINLNRDYDGCDLIFPEFGRRRYKAPYGGAIVFSTGALHEVTPITRGKRYAFVPFLYGEEDARLREANNELLQAGEIPYIGGRDKLFPDEAAQ